MNISHFYCFLFYKRSVGYLACISTNFMDFKVNDHVSLQWLSY